MVAKLNMVIKFKTHMLGVCLAIASLIKPAYSAPIPQDVFTQKQPQHLEIKSYLLQSFAMKTKDLSAMRALQNDSFYEYAPRERLGTILSYAFASGDIIKVLNHVIKKGNRYKNSVSLLFFTAEILKRKRFHDVQILFEKLVSMREYSAIGYYGLALMAINKGEDINALQYTQKLKNNNLDLYILTQYLSAFKSQDDKRKAILEQQIDKKFQPYLSVLNGGEFVTNAFTIGLTMVFPDVLSISRLKNYMVPKELIYQQDLLNGLLIGKFYEEVPVFLESITVDVKGQEIRYRAFSNLLGEDTLHVAKKILLTMPNNSPYTWLAKAKLANLDNDFVESLTFYRKLENMPGFVKDWLFYFEYGVVLERLKMLEESQEKLTYAMKMSDYNPVVLNYLAYSQIDNNRNLKGAFEILKIAYEDKPTAYIADSFGWAYYKLKDSKKALFYLEKSSETMPDDPVVNDHLGDVYYARNRKTEAIRHWKRALKYDYPNSGLKVIDVKRKLQISENE